jgi:hypothetical protein
MIFEREVWLAGRAEKDLDGALECMWVAEAITGSLREEEPKGRRTYSLTPSAQELDRELLCATSDPGSEAVPQLQQEIAETMARKEWLLGQVQRMEKAGPSEPPPQRRREVS